MSNHLSPPYPLAETAPTLSPRRELNAALLPVFEAAEGSSIFQHELRVWKFDGIISIRTPAGAKGLSAIVRSEVIAAEVVSSLEAASAILPLASPMVKVLPQDRYARTADYSHGRLIPPPNVRPQPFDLDLPPTGFRCDQADGLFVAIAEILRRYRALTAHAPHL